jgi:exonuclease SbcC
MIPLKLQIRNFMCYGEGVPPLDFSGIHLACLAGDNGHGKSALIDAITWALWGRARTQRDDDLIHLGKTDMSVEFEFSLAGNHYRVIRQRRKHTARGQTSLEFQIGDNGRFRSLTANTIRQTQQRINETLRVDYETFINSALLLQGRADEFTTSPPTERKRILGDILGLSLYDRLEERAKDSAAEKEVCLREIAAGLSEIDKELAHKERYEAELRSAEEEVTETSASLRAEEGKLRELREAARELKLKKEQFRDLATELEKLQAQTEETGQLIFEAQKRISVYEGTLAEKDGIQKGYAALIVARQENETLSRKLSEHARLYESKTQLQRAIDETRSQLALERELCAQRISGLEAKAGEMTIISRQLEVVRAKSRELSRMESEREELLRQEDTLSNQIASLQATNEQLKVEMGALKEKLDLLEAAEARCPLCSAPLPAGEKQRIKAQYTAEGKANGDQYRDNAAAIAELTQSKQRTGKAREAVDAQLKELGLAAGQEATLQTSLEQAATAKEDLEQAATELTRLDEGLHGDDFAHELRSKLAELDLQLQRLAYDPERHEQVRDDLASLSHFEGSRAELETARSSLAVENERLRELEQSRERLQEGLVESLTKKQSLQKQMEKLETTVAALAEQSRVVEELQAKESRARLQLGAAQQKLGHCLHLEKEKESKLLEQRQAEEQRAAYQELRLAFGKKGIQAMIIEAAMPEIEEQANRLLTRMTEGRMRVRFKSQRQTLKGEAVETLDIEVSDELGPRSYDLFSGGEAFRIDFAIRIALSKLLSRRAGASLQTLIIDEGFGTQDSQGRERLVEAINSVQEDFARILVITHIDELKNAFPVRIDVFKTAEGSQIALG